MEEMITNNQELSASNGWRSKICRSLYTIIEEANQPEVSRKGLSFKKDQIGQPRLDLDQDDLRIIRDKWGAICKVKGLPDNVRGFVGSNIGLLVKKRKEGLRRSKFCLIPRYKSKVDTLLAQFNPAGEAPSDSSGDNNLHLICTAFRSAIDNYNLFLQVPPDGVMYGITYPINDSDVEGIKVKWEEQCKRLNFEPVIKQAVTDKLNQLVEKLVNPRYQRFHTKSGLNPIMLDLLTPLLFPADTSEKSNQLPIDLQTA